MVALRPEGMNDPAEAVPARSWRDPSEHGKSGPVLSQQELETPRAAAQMLAWVEEAHLRFNTPALKAQARMGEGLASHYCMKRSQWLDSPINTSKRAARSGTCSATKTRMG